MDFTEVEENLFVPSIPKLHGEMCLTLSAIYGKVMSIFPTLEAARPRSKSGIHALCSLHVALEKTKNILQHCSESSKLYLAITGDSVLSKFEKTRCALEDSLRCVEDIVPQSIGYLIQEIVSELEGTVFSLDPFEKQIGNDIIPLLQQGRKFSNSKNTNELELFHQAAIKLGITSSRAALAERRALKKVLDRAQAEEDKRKESIVAYLLHLMRKYSKSFRCELSDDNDSQGSAPCSPTVQSLLDDIDSGRDANRNYFERQISKCSSSNLKSSNKESEQILVPPEELRCPISLQLMFDPVIVASGQTYERVCIEKWFNDGRNNCPKTQQKLSHLSLTPNYCVKGVIATWCDENGLSTPDGPPESIDLSYWRLVPGSESSNASFADYSETKKAKVVPMERCGSVGEADRNEADNMSVQEETSESNVFGSYGNLLAALSGGDWMKKCKAVEQIRILLKDDVDARDFMGASGFVEALLEFLNLASHERNLSAQESGSMALFNLAVNNNRNKEMMLEAGVIMLLEKMILNSNSHGYAAALYLNLSCLEDAKSIIGSSRAVPFMTHLLAGTASPQWKFDALHALYNLSTLSSNIPHLLSAGIVSSLQVLLSGSDDHSWNEKSTAILINLASDQSGRDEMISFPGLISSLATILDTGEPVEQEQVIECLLLLCHADENCSEMVLREGVIPGLVSISVNGTMNGIENAQKLLLLFRERRQQDQPPIYNMDNEEENSGKAMPAPESNPLCKSLSRRKSGKALGFLWKRRSYSVYQC